jgi:hypothetical protein
MMNNADTAAEGEQRTNVAIEQADYCSRVSDL